MPALQNEHMKVELNAALPLVESYELPVAGVRWGGADAGATLVIDGRHQPWPMWQVSARFEGGSAWYTADHRHEGWRLRWRHGLDRLKVTWGELTIADDHDRCLPVDGGIWLYSRDGGAKSFLLPPEWHRGRVRAYATGREGRQDPPRHRLSGGRIDIELPPRVPVRLVRAGG